MIRLFEFGAQRTLLANCIKYLKNSHRNWHRSQASPSD